MVNLVFQSTLLHIPPTQTLLWPHFILRFNILVRRGWLNRIMQILLNPSWIPFWMKNWQHSQPFVNGLGSLIIMKHRPKSSRLILERWTLFLPMMMMTINNPFPRRQQLLAILWLRFGPSPILPWPLSSALHLIKEHIIQHPSHKPFHSNHPVSQYFQQYRWSLLPFSPPPPHTHAIGYCSLWHSFQLPTIFQ